MFPNAIAGTVRPPQSALPPPHQELPTTGHMLGPRNGQYYYGGWDQRPLGTHKHTAYQISCRRHSILISTGNQSIRCQATTSFILGQIHTAGRRCTQVYASVRSACAKLGFPCGFRPGPHNLFVYLPKVHSGVTVQYPPITNTFQQNPTPPSRDLFEFQAQLCQLAIVTRGGTMASMRLRSPASPRSTICNPRR